VEALTWRKSTRSGTNGDCIEIATHRDRVLIRDSKDPDGPQLSFPTNSWRAFIDTIKR
jgi:hypothetical protein